MRRRSCSRDAASSRSAIKTWFMLLRVCLRTGAREHVRVRAHARARLHVRARARVCCMIVRHVIGTLLILARERQDWGMCGRMSEETANLRLSPE